MGEPYVSCHGSRRLPPRRNSNWTEATKLRTEASKLRTGASKMRTGASKKRTGASKCAPERQKCAPERQTWFDDDAGRVQASVRSGSGLLGRRSSPVSSPPRRVHSSRWLQSPPGQKPRHHESPSAARTALIVPSSLCRLASPTEAAVTTTTLVSRCCKR